MIFMRRLIFLPVQKPASRSDYMTISLQLIFLRLNKFNTKQWTLWNSTFWNIRNTFFNSLPNSVCFYLLFFFFFLTDPWFETIIKSFFYVRVFFFSLKSQLFSAWWRCQKPVLPARRVWLQFWQALIWLAGNWNEKIEIILSRLHFGQRIWSLSVWSVGPSQVFWTQA